MDVLRRRTQPEKMMTRGAPSLAATSVRSPGAEQARQESAGRETMAVCLAALGVRRQAMPAAPVATSPQA